MKNILTIFTPAYNRAHTIGRTYESLKSQSCKEFIWLIVDDGSTDETAKLVKEWQQQDNGFEIQYIYKENGGMHTAHNTAYENIKTELNTCIDSDDCMAEEAVAKILAKWNEIKDCGYAGMIGLDYDMKGNLIGKEFPKNMVETTLTGYYAAGGKGDKKLVYRTEIVKKYPKYPVFEGEKYVSLSILYELIDQDYKLATLNDALCEVEYQDTGSSMTMMEQYRKNPKGFAYLRLVNMHYPVSIKRTIMDSIHYVSSSIFAKDKHFLQKVPHKLLVICAVPFGCILNLYIQFKTRDMK